MSITRTPKAARTARVASVMSPLSRAGRGSQHTRRSEIEETRGFLVAAYQTSTNYRPPTERLRSPPREETDDEVESHLGAIKMMARQSTSIPEYDTDMGSVASAPGDTDHEADWDSRSESQSSMCTDGSDSDHDVRRRPGAPRQQHTPTDDEFEPEDRPTILTLEDDSPEVASLQRVVTRSQTDEDETEDDSRRESDGEDDDKSSDGGFTSSGERDAVRQALDTSSNLATSASIRRLLRPGGIVCLLGDDAARLVEEEMEASPRRHSRPSHVQDESSSRDNRYSFSARAARRSRYDY